MPVDRWMKKKGCENPLMRGWRGGGRISRNNAYKNNKKNVTLRKRGKAAAFYELREV